MTSKPCFLTLASALHSQTCAPNLARRFAVKHPPYPTNPNTARALDRVRIEQARQILARLSSEQNAPKPTKPTKTAPEVRQAWPWAGANAARDLSGNNPPKPTKPTKTKVAPSNLASRRPRFLNAPCAAENTPKPTKPTRASYTFPVTSKKGVIGIGLPSHPLRRKPQSLPQSTCGLFVRASSFWRLGQGAARLAGSRKRVSGRPTCSSCRPRLVSGAVVFANHTRLEAFNG